MRNLSLGLKLWVAFVSLLAGMLIGVPVAVASGPASVDKSIIPMFGGRVNASTATTGQVLARQSDGSWAGATVSANIQTLLDGISTTQGTILYYNGTDWVALSPGTSGHFLKTQGAGANPTWAASSFDGNFGTATATWGTGGTWAQATPQILGPTDANLFMAAASAGASSAGRSLKLYGGPGGSSSGNAGSVVLEAGTPVSGNGGHVNITATSGVGTNKSAGSVAVVAGGGTGTQGGGNAQLSAGSGASGSTGGSASVQGGAGGTGNGGNASLIAGPATSGTATGGTANVLGSDGAGGNSNGGSVLIQSGSPSGAGTRGTITLTTQSATTGAISVVGVVTVQGDLKFTDATYDIGKSGATRPRNIFASGTGTFGGNVSTGILTCTGFQTALTTKTADYTATTADQVILVNSASTPTTITLYAASGNSGRRLVIKNLHATGTVTIDGNASETIDGSTTKTISTQYGSYTIVCDGSNWFIE